MATLKYKTPEGEWKKVSIGGGGSTEEVYVGSDAPTDDNVKVWIDPQGTPSQPSQPSADNGIRYYVLPEGLVSSLKSDSEYTFTSEEAEVYNKVCSEWKTHNYIVLLNYVDSYGYLFKGYPTDVVCDGVHMRIKLGSDSFMQDEAQTDIININETPDDDGAIKATV